MEPLNALEPSTTETFLRRYRSFRRATLDSVEQRYVFSGRRELRLNLTMYGVSRIEDYHTSKFLIIIPKVSELRFRERLATHHGLRRGLAVAWLEGLAWCDFAPPKERPTTVEEFRKSNFYVAGEAFVWRATHSL